MTPDEQSSLDANKREMFDAMRAYHESELTHKEHAVSLLTTILTAVGALFAAIILPDRLVPNAQLLALLAAVSASIGAYVVVSTTNKKIEKDHEQYVKFGAEYVRTAEALGYYTSADGKQALKTDRDIGRGTGYQDTQAILRMVGGAFSVLAWVATAYVTCALIPAHEKLSQRAPVCHQQQPTAPGPNPADS